MDGDIPSFPHYVFMVKWLVNDKDNIALYYHTHVENVLLQNSNEGETKHV
jgi:hypothetical protein